MSDDLPSAINLMHCNHRRNIGARVCVPSLVWRATLALLPIYELATNTGHYQIGLKSYTLLMADTAESTNERMKCGTERPIHIWLPNVLRKNHPASKAARVLRLQMGVGWCSDDSHIVSYVRYVTIVLIFENTARLSRVFIAFAGRLSCICPNTYTTARVWHVDHLL